MSIKINWSISLISCLFIFNSCQKNTPPIAAEKMEQILTDIQIMETYSKMLPTKDSVHTNSNKNVDSLALYYAQLFNYYKLTKEDFLNGMEWYRQHPILLDTIYAHMLPKLSALEGKYEQKQQFKNLNKIH